MPKPKRYRRRQYIVDPEFQYGMIRQICALAAVMVVMSLGFLTMIYYLYGDVQLALLQPDPFAPASRIDSLRGQRTLLDMLWPTLSVCLLIALIVTFVSGLLYSHRLAGPVFRIRRILKEMAEGDLRGQDRLRRKDEFKGLMESVNQVKEIWRDRIRQLEAACREMETGPEGRDPGPVSRMRRILDGFRVE